MLYYALTIALSAFLLFEVQPIIAKMILPWFGGSSAVWSTCMLFFQVLLLLGYLYAHWLHEKLAAREQAIVHILVLAASLTALPILSYQTGIPTGFRRRAPLGHESSIETDPWVKCLFGARGSTPSVVKAGGLIPMVNSVSRGARAETVDDPAQAGTNGTAG